MTLTSSVHSVGLSPADWLSFLRIGLGLWWLESWRHKNKRAWLKEGAGISWAKSVAEKHRYPAVRRGFAIVVEPRQKLTAHVIVFSELAIGLGITLGLLTPIALAGAFLLNLIYFVLMVSDWAEQGQNSMMALIAVVCGLAQANQAFSLDRLFHIFGA